MSISSFPLTRELYEKVASSSCFYSNIQFIPQGTYIQFVEDLGNNVLEIGIPKKVYLCIFKEGHSYFKGIYPREKDVHNLSQSILEEVYFATLSLLLTTNDYSTVWRLHEQVLSQLSRSDKTWINNDFAFCTALATSRLDKINKSSSLWHWLRRLSLRFLFLRNDCENLYNFLRQIVRSMESHLANYAAGYTYVWCVQIARSIRTRFGVFDEKIAVSLIRDKCRQKLADTSLWSSYASILSFRTAPYIDTDIKRLQQETKNKIQRIGISEGSRKGQENADIEGSMNSRKNPEATVNVTSYLQMSANQELQWLLSIRCTVESPYTHILNILQDTDLSQRMIRDILEKEVSGHIDNKFAAILEKLSECKC